jgi:nitrate reductase cytochrome c-type subunit
VLGSASNLCLSCHDGTVAPGTNVPYTGLKMTGAMNSQDLFIGTLQGIHPFNFKLPLNCTNDNLLSSLCSGSTGNAAVQLIGGNVQCNSCHNPHVQAIDPVAQNFLVMNNANSAMCLACHVSQPSDISATRVHTANTGANTVAGTGHSQASTYNPFTAWRQSIHAMAAHKLSKGAKVGPYSTVNQNACLSCHTPHNAPGGPQLLSGPLPVVPNMDAATQDCITCHNGGSNLSPAIPNVFAEFAKTGQYSRTTGMPRASIVTIHTRRSRRFLLHPQRYGDHRPERSALVQRMELRRWIQPSTNTRLVCAATARARANRYWQRSGTLRYGRRRAAMN